MKMNCHFDTWIKDTTFTPFYHIEHGGFSSMEGYKGWLETKEESFRSVYGFSSLNKRHHFETVPYCSEDMEIAFYQGYFSKLVHYPDKITDLIFQSIDHLYWQKIQSILTTLTKGDYDKLPDLYFDPIIYDLCEGTVVSCLPAQ